jgi:hypothetical protein
MKQIWPNYSYSPTTNVLTLTGLNIDRDQLLLVTAADRGRIIYNFADSSVTASAFTSGANTALTLVATTAGLTTTAALVIYYDDQVASNSVTVSSLPAISGTVTANLGGGIFEAREEFNGVINKLGVQIYNTQGQAIGGTGGVPLPISGTVTIGSALPAGTNRIGVVTIGAGTVTIGAGTAQIGSVTASISNFPGVQQIYGTTDVASLPPISGVVTASLSAGTSQIGSVTASISGTVPISISSVTVGNSVTIGSCVTHGVTIANSSVTVNGSFFQATQPVSLNALPALVAGTAQIGSVTASISNTVPISISSVTVGNSVTIGSLPAISGTVTANTFALQGTAVTTSNFTSTTASTVLASFNSTREVLTIFNEGAGNLHICAGATCTTIAYQVRLSAGDYYEVPNHQTSLTHSAVFATAGTARVCQVS